MQRRINPLLVRQHASGQRERRYGVHLVGLLQPQGHLPGRQLLADLGKIDLENAGLPPK